MELVKKASKGVVELFSKWGIKEVSMLGLILTLFPFFVLCFFVQPSFVDDYCFIIKTKELGLTSAFLDWYTHWTGRYSLCFLMSFNPLLIGSFFLYKLLIGFMIALLPLLVFFCFKRIFKNQERSFYISFTALFSLFYFYQLPSVNEGLFWMTGAVAYQLPTLCLLGLFILLHDLCTDRSNPWMTCLLSIILAVVLIGTNEISMVVYMTFLCLFTAFSFFKKTSHKKLLLILLFVSLVASLFVVCAPGNQTRATLFPMANDLPQALYMTLLGCLYYVGQWLAMSFVMMILAFYVLSKTKLELSKHALNLPVWMSAGSFVVILLAGFFVPAWATGQMPNPRAINVIFFVFLIGLFYHILFMYAFFITHQISIGTGKIGATLVIFFLFFLIFSPGKQSSNNIRTAYVDIVSGKAYDFHVSMIKSYQTGEIEDLPQEMVPVSLRWETSDKPYGGCPEKYFKVYYKK